MSVTAADSRLQTLPSAGAGAPLPLGDAEAFLDALAALCAAAGAEIMALYGDCAVERKADQSPVTEADRRAEAVIAAGLAQLAPGVPIVAEEATEAGHCPDPCAEFFLVDPLDGTKEFIRGPAEDGQGGDGNFTVNIALIRGGIPVAGAVYAPAQERIWAGAGGVAWTALLAPKAGAPLRDKAPIAVRAAHPAGPVALTSRSSNSTATEAYVAQYKPAKTRHLSSSVKLCHVATGEAQIYARLGRTMEWDIAAGDAVLRAAGGAVRTLEGTPIVYGRCATDTEVAYANPAFVALGGVDFIAPA